VDFALIAFTASIILLSITGIAQEIDMTIDFTIGALFNLNNIVLLLYVCLQIEFLLYLKDLKKLYTLPIVASFYIGSGLVLYETDLPLIIFALTSGIITFAVLAKEGAKNRNGLALGIAVFIIINGTIKVVEVLLFNLDIAGPILRLVAISVMLLGTSGFIDKYILIDLEQEEKITNIWISKVVTKDNR
jgi:hypothetical protein